MYTFCSSCVDQLILLDCRTTIKVVNLKFHGLSFFIHRVVYTKTVSSGRRSFLCNESPELLAKPMLIFGPSSCLGTFSRLVNSIQASSCRVWLQRTWKACLFSLEVKSCRAGFKTAAWNITDFQRELLQMTMKYWWSLWKTWLIASWRSKRNRKKTMKQIEKNLK